MSTSSDPYGQGPRENDRNPDPNPPAPAYGQQAPRYEQGGYPAAPASDPGYGAQPGYPTGRAPSNGMGIAALILGILALLGCWIPFVNIISIVLAIVGIILGILALRKVKRGESTNRGMALTGIILSAIALILSVVISVALGAFIGSNIDEIQNCADPNLTQAEQQACIEEQINN